MNTGNASARRGEDGFPAPAYAWYVAAVLTAAHVISFLDRQILSLLVGPIKRDLQISDTQMSLLMGLAFALLYTIAAIPLGRLADRRSRRNIITVGIAAWCAATAMCGLAKNYGQLFMARVGVGIGEATLTPSALSMLSDYFPPQKRGAAIGCYNMGVSVGAGIAFIVGGQVIGFVTTSPPITLPVVGELYAWQTVFLVVGLPGLVIAALMRTVREPQRQGKISVADPSVEHISLGDAARFLAARRKTYGGLAAVVSGTTILGYGFLNWIPSMFQRTWGLGMPEIATDLGLVLLIAGPIGVNGGGWLADRWYRQGHEDAHLRVMLWSAPVMLIASAALPLMPTPGLALLMFVPHILAAAAITAAGGAALMVITPNQLRAQATAIYYFIISLAGLTLGPTSVAMLTDFVFADEASLRYSMAIVGFAAPLLSVAGAALIRRPYLQSMAEAREWND
ncbi:MAG: MFS transporter [Gammaproteobacteria bacterium]|nr:MFS transporter [Gammaproteobacteria bacterium]